jgi:hypothetical protein
MCTFPTDTPRPRFLMRRLDLKRIDRSPPRLMFDSVEEFTRSQERRVEDDRLRGGVIPPVSRPGMDT